MFGRNIYNNSLKEKCLMNKEPIVLTSADPLPNELTKLKKLYWFFLILAALGIIWNGFLAIGLIGFVILYLIDYGKFLPVDILR